MAKLYVECDSNATAARRIWINRYHWPDFWGTVNRIQIFAEKNVHGPKIFSVCINQALFIFQEKSIAMKQLLF